MNESAWLARLLAFGGVLETVAGLGLLAAPSALATLLTRSPLEGGARAVGRLAGGGLLALGIACWCARGTPLAPAGLGVSWAFLAYNAIACVTLFRARPALRNGGLPALAASALHGVIAAALLVALIGHN